MLSQVTSQKNILQPGQQAPDFSLETHRGQTISLVQELLKSPVVLFFYPKNNTAVCTKQACSFRDAFADFKTLNVTLLGISSDSIQSHQQFSEKHQLPFLLLSDSDYQVAKQYGIKKTLGILPGRVTFVIDQKQTIQLAYNDAFNHNAHIEKALHCVKHL
ncbi:MAG: peroxiredoxin [Cyanobacteria bacterium P01_H01_bin.74]